MLNFISIRNFAIIEHWDLELRTGLSTVTGESGAGKSILIDAIELALGARADSAVIRQGATRAEITLHFELSHLPKVQSWLKAHDYEDEESQCVIRRVLTTEGRSRSSINGSSCTIQHVKDLASLLMNIHGQHQNQALMNKVYQLDILDYFAGHTHLIHDVKNTYKQWKNVHQQLSQLQNNRDSYQAQLDLLSYQVNELDEFNLEEHEYDALDHEQKNLANAEQFTEACQQSLQCLSAEDSATVIDQLHFILNKLNSMNCDHSAITNAQECINHAVIHCEEAKSELHHFTDQFNADPERLAEVEHRLSAIHDLARKHHVEPHGLYAHHQALTLELDNLKNAGETIARYQQQLQKLAADYSQQAQKLSVSRKSAATKLCAKVSEKLQLLGMKGGKFDIAIHPTTDQQPRSSGQDTIEFMVSANPGQPLQPLSKVASGGEISRIALAIQVIASQTMITPTLVFDEVDVGISGSTAAVVGNILRELGQSAQVLCITHQPQVAASGHQHIHVHKMTEANKTFTQVEELSDAKRVEEIARMLGGLTITEKTLDNAKELLASV